MQRSGPTSRTNRTTSHTCKVFILAVAATLFAWGLATAQTTPQLQVDPRFQKQLDREGFVNPPTAPILVSPDDNAVRMPELNTNDPLTFIWRSAEPVVGADTYKLHLCFRPAKGTEQCALLFQGSRTFQYAPPGGLAAMTYQGQIMSWRVEACRNTNFKNSAQLHCAGPSTGHFPRPPGGLCPLPGEPRYTQSLRTPAGMTF